MDIRVFAEEHLPGQIVRAAVSSIRAEGLNADAYGQLAAVDDPRIVELRKECKNLIDCLSDEERTELVQASDLIHPRSVDHASPEALVATVVWAAVARPLSALKPEDILPPDSDSPILAQWPELVPRLDKDGLLLVEPYMRIENHPWCLRHADGYLGFSQVVGSDPVFSGLISTLWRWRDCTHGELRFRMDYGTVHANPTPGVIKLAQLYGPKLTSERVDDERAVGVTVYWDPEASANRAFHSHLALVATVSLQPDTGEKVCTVEELVPLDGVSPNQPFVGVRYLHAVRDIATRTFRHCDGAIRCYDLDQYQRRIAVFDKPAPEKSAGYTKAWRIDGPIDTATWTNLVARWFTGDYLALELLEHFGDAQSIADDEDMQRYIDLRRRLNPQFRTGPTAAA